MKPAEHEAWVRRRRRRVLIAVGVAGLVLMAAAVSRTLGDLRMGRAHESELRRQIADSEARIEQLEDRARRLRSDAAEMETLAREELLMARPGEMVILLPEETAEADAAPPPADRPAADPDLGVD